LWFNINTVVVALNFMALVKRQYTRLSQVDFPVSVTLQSFHNSFERLLIYASLFRQKQAVKKQTKETKINTEQDRATQYQQRHHAIHIGMIWTNTELLSGFESTYRKKDAENKKKLSDTVKLCNDDGDDDHDSETN